jgi:DNA-binding response OmpR family regulator
VNDLPPDFWRILVVGEAPVILRLVRDKLDRAGFEVLMAASRKTRKGGDT